MDEIAIYDCSWTRTRDGKAKLRLFVTDTEGFKTKPVYLDLPVPPYFYTLKEVVETKGLPEGMKAELMDVVFGITATPGQVYKIITNEPSEVPGLRDFYGVKNTCEADVPYGRRVMIDRDLTISMPKKKLYIDIEADPRGGLPDPEKADKRLLSIATCDQDGNVEFFWDKDEVAMLSRFLMLLDKYPVVCTYFGNGFDWPYLQNRCRKLDIRFYWGSVVHIDLHAVLRYVLQEKFDRWTLDYVAQEILGISKPPIKIGELWDSFEGDGAKLRERNVWDATATRLLDQERDLTSIMFAIAKTTHTRVTDLLRVNERNNKEWNPSIAIDALNLVCSGRRIPPIIWPSREFKEDSAGQKKYTGALVLDPVPGVHNSVIILDVNSLYPSIIRSLNVGPETYRANGSGDNEAPIGSFVSEPESVMSESIRTLTELREKYRREKNAAKPQSAEWKAAYAKESAMKVVGLTVYGVSGSRHTRYFMKDIAENVTLSGRMMLDFMKNELESMGYPVIYGDTDSVMFKVSPEDPDIVGTAKFMSKYLTERSKSFLEETFHPKKIVFNLDVAAVCSSMWIQPAVGKGKDEGTKKRYAALVIWDKEDTVYLLRKGLEIARHDWSKASREAQEEGLIMKLTDYSLEQQSAAAGEWKRKLFSCELDDDIVIWKGLNKNLDEYKVETQPLRVAKMLMEKGLFLFHKNEKVGFVKVGPKPEQIVAVVDVIPTDLDTGARHKFTEAEYSFIWTKQFKSIYDRLLIPSEDTRMGYATERQKKLWAKKKKAKEVQATL